MEQKRFLAFFILSVAIFIGWNTLVVPRLLPPPPPAAKKDAAKEKDPAKEPAAEKPDAAVKEGDGEKVAGEDQPGGTEVAAKDDPEQKAQPPIAEQAEGDKPPATVVPKFPAESVLLGSDDPKSGYRQAVTLTSMGAAVEKIELNDDRYRALTKPHPPLTVVGADHVHPFTLSMIVPQVADADVSKLHWELVPGSVLPAEQPHNQATFRLRISELELEKHYSLAQVVQNGGQVDEAPAYQLGVELKFRNLGGQQRTVNYELQGPTGVPLENVDNTQKFRDIVVGFVDGAGSKYELLSGKTIAEGNTQEWRTEFDYIGVDVQYFAALLLPGEDQRKVRYIKSAIQKLIGLPLAERSEVSVVLTSEDLDLQPAKDKAGKDAVTHSYKLFAGPKRDDVLPSGADKIVDYGWFHWISRPMLSLLKGFYRVFGNWGVAIICLTVLVRGALFPLSIKQARGAAKMQELQPEIAALKEKYGKDKEKMARAQMELFSKHNYNPLAGCLPVFLQLPIFIGLYNALSHAVDLRLAKFLWIQNLAAPDALFDFGFVLPLLGWKQFNLLPLISVVLMIFQQKMFMPPPTNDEQAFQQKMMSYMMVFMGIMLYKVPAGLGVYFIASSLWGMAERKLLPKAKPATSPPGATGTGGSDAGGGRPPKRPSGNEDDNGNGHEGFLARLLKAAEKETSARRQAQGKRK